MIKGYMSRAGKTHNSNSKEIPLNSNSSLNNYSLVIVVYAPRI